MIHLVPMLSDTATNLSSYTHWIYSNFCFVNTETLFMITRHLDNTCSSRPAYKFSVHRPHTAPHRLIFPHPFATPPSSKTSSSCTLNTPSHTALRHKQPHLPLTTPQHHSPHHPHPSPQLRTHPSKTPSPTPINPLPSLRTNPPSPNQIHALPRSESNRTSLSSTTARDLSPHPEHPAPATETDLENSFAWTSHDTGYLATHPPPPPHANRTS